MKVLQDTGDCTLAIDQWDDKVAADKSWSTFQTHFDTANQRRLETTNSSLTSVRVFPLGVTWILVRNPQKQRKQALEQQEKWMKNNITKKTQFELCFKTSHIRSNWQ